MAQLYIPDEDYQTLQTLAQAKGMTPEQLLTVVIEYLEMARERSEYGDDFIEELRQQANNLVEPHRHLSEEAFFADLDAHRCTITFPVQQA